MDCLHDMSTRPFITERLFMGHKEPNQTTTTKIYEHLVVWI